MQADSCADVDFYASSDVDADASSDRIAHSCAEHSNARHDLAKHGRAEVLALLWQRFVVSIELVARRPRAQRPVMRRRVSLGMRAGESAGGAGSIWRGTG